MSRWMMLRRLSGSAFKFRKYVFPLASAATNARSTRPRRHLVLSCCIVISRLDYCNRVLAGLPATTVVPLQRILHAAARLVNGLRPNDYVTPALKELHWLPIKQRVDYKLCFLVHKVTVRQAPSYLTGMLTAVTEVPSLSTLRDASNGNYVIPRTRLKFDERAFSVAAPRAWNRLPTELKLMRSTPVFRRSLKTFLFQSRLPTVPSLAPGSHF